MDKRSAGGWWWSSLAAALALVAVGCASEDAGDRAEELEGRTGRLLATDARGNTEELGFVVRHGRAIHDDIDFGPVTADMLRARGLVSKSLSKRWADNTVYYDYDVLPAQCDPVNNPGCECPTTDPCTPLTGAETTVGSERYRVRYALDTLESLTDLEFIRGKVAGKPYFTFAHQSGSGFTHADPGGPGGLNGGFPVQVTFSTFSERTVLHEVGHVLGFAHEQKRPDFATAVTINPLCLDSDAGASFDTASLANQKYLTPFDLDSVMLYTSFSKSRAECGAPTGPLPNAPCCPTMMKKTASPAATYRYVVPAGGITSTWNGTNYAAAAGTILNFPGEYIAKTHDGDLPGGHSGISREDLNGLYQMYPPKLSVRDAGDRFGYEAARGDFDGDGYTDLAVGAPHEGAGGHATAGTVFLYKGTYTGLIPWRVLEEHPSGTGAEVNDRFGSALTVGDLDGDTIDDLVVGAPNKRAPNGSRAGAIYLFRGSSSGLTQGDHIFQGDYTGYFDHDDDDFGSALNQAHVTSGQQVLVGAPAVQSSAGRLYVLTWSSTATFHHGTGTGTLNLTSRLGADQTAGNRFGTAVAAADLDDDGYADLAVGAPDAGSDGNGKLFIFKGGSAGTTFLGSIAHPGLGPDANFGRAVKIARFRSSTGRRQIAVGAPDDASGMVYVMEVTLTSASVTLTQTQGLQQQFLDQSNDDRFGYSLAAGDLNGDGVSELVIGSSGDDRPGFTDAGAIWIWKGVAGGSIAMTAGGRWERPSSHGLPASNDNFGEFVTIGDFDDKAPSDLAIGLPGASGDKGAIFVMQGRNNQMPAFASDELVFTTYLDAASQADVQK